jgi:Tfp pilus assembly protein PilN
MSVALNLARRPLQNERLPTLLLAFACACLVFLSVSHAVLAIQLRHGGARDVEGQVAALDREIDRLRAESAELQRTQPPRGRLAEWAAVRELVDRRVFSWTGLLAALETALPPSVRLESIAPSTGKGPTVVSLNAIGQSAQDAFALMKALQASPAFDGAFLEAVGDSAQGVLISCSVVYVGRRAPAPAPAAAAAAAAAGPTPSAAPAPASAAARGSR